MKKILSILGLIMATCVLADNFPIPQGGSTPKPVPASLSVADDGTNYVISLTVTPDQLKAYLPVFAHTRTGAATNLSQVLGTFSQFVVSGAANTQMRPAQFAAAQAAIPALLTQIPTGTNVVTFSP